MPLSKREIVTFAVGFFLFINSIASYATKGPFRNISIISLIAAPEKFLNKEVGVEGVLEIEAGQIIFLNKDSQQFLIYENGISLQFDSLSQRENLSSLNGKWVNIVGKLEKYDEILYQARSTVRIRVTKIENISDRAFQVRKSVRTRDRSK